MGEYKTPGVYIKEKNAFGTSVVEVETAVPAFIGYTEKALNGTEDLTGKPWKITSMAEFNRYFGGMHAPKYTIGAVTTPTPAPEPDKKDDADEPAPAPAPAAGGKSFTVKTSDGTAIHPFTIQSDNNYALYLHMLLFFANGGGPCYIVSVGKYKEDGSIVEKELEDAISTLEKEAEPTMLVIPEAVNLNGSDCYKLQQQMAMHCGGEKQKNRVAILDAYINKYPDKPLDKVDYISNFRNGFSTDYPSYVAAYYPYIATSVLSDSDITQEMIVLEEKLSEFIKNFGWDENQINLFQNTFLKEAKADSTTSIDPELDTKLLSKSVHLALLQSSIVYQQLVKAILDDMNLLPPSAAIAGVYTSVDNTRGVWKAPANVTINSVVKPSVNINDYDQEDINMPMSGKAVNAIRTFPGEGLKIWGARTMDGNSQDWRYINVRRTMIYLEQSVKNAARGYVFEPNDANTWINMKCMIENFLRSVWKRGGLAGATPEDAFEVHVGLGDTMTGDDILEGILRITVLVAISRPAEFIEITFQQQMQKS